MRYLPKSPAERDQMLRAVGAESIDDLFSSIPERFRLREALNLPGPYSEAEIIQYSRNAPRRVRSAMRAFWELVCTTTCARLSRTPLSSVANS